MSNTDELDGLYETSPPHTIHRRTSVSRPLFSAGEFDELSLIPPPIPESLPTTPGFELTNDIYFDRRKNPLEIPDQQPFLPLPDSSNEIPEMTLQNPPKNKWRVISVCIWIFAAGMSDGAPGALLGYIESYYHISYSIVSLIWLSNAIGFILIAVLSNSLDSKLGKQKMIAGGCTCTMVMYAIVSSGTKFYGVCIGFFIGGVGLAACLSQMNIYLSKFNKLSTYLGWFHGSYGLGATVAPIIASSMVNRGVTWHYFYLILLGCAVINCINMWLAFVGADEDLKPWDVRDSVVEPKESETTETTETTETDAVEMEDINDVENIASHYRSEDLSLPPPQEPVIAKAGVFKLAVKNLKTWLLTLFVFLYQGAEVSLPGWEETFLTDYRGGSRGKLGYTPSGFWAGLTISRIFFVERLHKQFGAKRGVFILAIFSVVFVALGWGVKNIIAELVLISISGLFVGPIYPLMITIATRVLPRKIQVISLTIMTSGGSSGGALWPFLIGLISQFSGAFVVMPVFISLFSAMIVCWFILPNPDRSIVKLPWQRIF